MSESAEVREPSRVVLGGYPAKLCARAVHNDFSPVSPPKPPVDAATQQLFDAGNSFESLVNQQLAAGGALLLTDDNGWDANALATMNAMRDGVDVIVNGRFPRVGSRAGAPDVLVRIGDGYVPVDVKLHGTRNESSRGSVWVSSLSSPAERREVMGLSESGSHVEHDGMQLVHYTRMLQELGLHAGEGHLVGGIIGKSDFTAEGGDPWLVQWYDLSVARRVTYSASVPGGRAKRNLLERYDHEFSFRVAVAAEARAGGEKVRPFHIHECSRCVWVDYCRQVAGTEDASFSTLTGLPTAQQWRHLYDVGVSTVADLAAQDPEVMPAGWGDRDTQPHRAGAKYRDLVHRARMTVAGVEFVPVDAWPSIPQADVEIDFDIEWDLEQRIYLWGIRIRQGQDDTTAVFDPIVSYEQLDDGGAAVLADAFASRLTELLAAAESEGKSLQVFHWTHAERSMTAKYPVVAELLGECAFDLHAWFSEHFLARGGNSIKVVAPIFGFEWAVEDAGGVESQLRIEVARAGGPEAHAAREWLARYNDSDVAAQAAIRDGLREARSRASENCDSNPLASATASKG